MSPKPHIDRWASPEESRRLNQEESRRIAQEITDGAWRRMLETNPDARRRREAESIVGRLTQGLPRRRS